ncbi:flagellar basal body-associated FliL family protein [Shewanella donghaensis]|uniref:flagellar basal body-associated FliL family protein n=1 Tax=Shewanella donghaensis TaxID=238836 RepID=UPI001182AD6E|nr:flagellar basal body-associated FliL family protein [Shewanella donghaensis]
MAIGKNKLSKIIGFAILFCTWSAGVFWMGWKSPEMIGAPFSVYQPAPKPASFFPLDKFVFSIQGTNNSHYLLLELALKSRSKDAETTIKNADSLIKNALMKMFSEKSHQQLITGNQLDPLQIEALELLTAVLSENDFNIELEDVLFTKMVIQ